MHSGQFYTATFTITKSYLPPRRKIIMKIQSLFVVSIICFFCNGAFAESSAAVTGLCKDGTSFTGTSKKGACRGHKGVKEWLGDKADAATTSPAPAAAAAPAPATTASGPATGLCKDGTAYTGESKKGACRGHKGIKEWYADKQNPAASAAAPVAVPAAATTAAAIGGTATGLCKDGTAYTGASKRGACRGHKGIKEWYADKQAPATIGAAPAATTPAAAPVAVPADGIATGLCKDGTSYTGSSRRGACRGHKGIQEWYADKKFSDPKPAAPVQAAPAATPNPAQSASPAVPASAPAAGSGKVWVNTRSKIYHCEGTKFYGDTKEGEYMSEADAQAKGYNANRKKVCNK
jgi:hypothetical protein